jgi:uncharacterized protein involved in exopolysaccharide biosynthesis
VEPKELEAVEPAPESRGDLANALLIPLVRSKWVILACAILGAAAGIAAGIIRPNTYVSSGKLLVRSSSREDVSPDALLSGGGGGMPSQLRDQVNNELQLLTVPHVFEIVATKVTPPRIFSAYDPAADDREDTPYFTKLFHAYQAKWFRADGGARTKKLGHSVDNCPSCIREAVHALQTDIRLVVEPGSSVLTIVYAAHDPALARDVVAAFIEASEKHHRESFSSNSTFEFVKSRYQDSEKAEQDSATTFAEYRANCGVTDYETQRIASMTSVRELEAAKDTDDLALRSLKSKLKVVSDQLADVPRMIPQQIERSPLANPNWTLLSGRVLTIQDQIELLSARVGGTTTERDAEKTALEKRLHIAQTQLDHTDQWIAQEATTQTAPNPEYTRLKQDHDQLEQQIAAQEDVVAKGKERLKNAEERLRSIDSCAPRYKELEGQYTTAKTIKEQWRTALEKATLSNLLEELQFTNLWRIQEASLPFEKDGPKRAKFVIVGLILGLGLGSAFGFLRLQLDPKLRSPNEVEHVLGAKVLSVVPPTGLSWRLRRAIQKAGG